jgi:apolipoprotein N-acyltransferase
MLGVIVCNEAMYPEDSASRVREGATVLANLSNDSWIRAREFAEHQLRFAALRAVEQRRYLVRASTSGPSAIVEPTGRIQTRSGVLSAAVLSGEIASREERTVYARLGDAFAWICLVVTAVAVGLARLLRS